MSKSDVHTIRKLKLQVRVLVFSVLNDSELLYAGQPANADVFPPVTGSAEPVRGGNTSAFAGYMRNLGCGLSASAAYTPVFTVIDINH